MTPLPLQTTAAELAEHAQLLADIADPERDPYEQTDHTAPTQAVARKATTVCGVFGR